MMLVAAAGSKVLVNIQQNKRSGSNANAGKRALESVCSGKRSLVSPGLPKVSTALLIHSSIRTFEPKDRLMETASWSC